MSSPSPSPCPSLHLHLSYTPRELYSVVANVPSYSTFVPFCTASTVLPPSPSSALSSISSGKISREEPFEVEAELRIGFMSFSEGYVSQVKGRPFDSVEVSKVSVCFWCLGLAERRGEGERETSKLTAMSCFFGFLFSSLLQIFPCRPSLPQHHSSKL